MASGETGVASLLLKTIFAMPLQKMRMGTLREPLRSERDTILVNERMDAIQIICLARDEYPKIIGKADQPSIKHPVDRTRESDAITDDIRAAGFNRADVGCGGLCPAPAVDKSNAADGAAFRISS